MGAIGSASTSAGPTPISCCSMPTTGAAAGREGREHAEESRRSACSTASRASCARGIAPERDRVLRPWHHHHHQRAARDARRQGRAPHHQGLPRRAGDPEPGARRQSVRLFLREAAADRAAEPDAGNPRALRLLPATCSCRSTARRCARPRASSRPPASQSIAVCFLFSFLNPAHEKRDARHHPRGISRRACLAVERGAAAHPRMAAAVDDAAQRLSRAGAGALSSRISSAGLDEAGIDTQQRFLMQSNGGVMPFAAAIAGGRTVHTLFSGPAAGAQASAYLAARRGAAAASSRSTWAAPAPTSPSSRAACRSK